MGSIELEDPTSLALDERFLGDLVRHRRHGEFGSIDQAGFACRYNSLKARMSSERGKQLRDVVPHRHGAHAQVRSDLLGGLARGEEAQDVELPWCQRSLRLQARAARMVADLTASARDDHEPSTVPERHKTPAGLMRLVAAVADDDRVGHVPRSSPREHLLED
jgi:hypothetical protein